MNQSIPPLSLFAFQYRALVIGAGGAIGGEFVRQLQADTRCTYVTTVSRSQGTGFDLTDDASIQAAADMAGTVGPFALIVDATGALHVGGKGPEKSLASLNADQLMQSFQINTIGPTLVLRHFARWLAPGPSIYAKLSARVGSISDNQKGGWYGYRSSKAAMNMVLQTAAIELQRKNADLRVVALQPGTVQSALSVPFLSGVPQVLQPAESVAGLLQALRTLPAKAGAHFVDYKGQAIAW